MLTLSKKSNKMDTFEISFALMFALSLLVAAWVHP